MASTRAKGDSHRITVDEEIAHLRVIISDKTERQSGARNPVLYSNEELLEFARRALLSIAGTNRDWFAGVETTQPLSNRDILKEIQEIRYGANCLMPINNIYLQDFELIFLKWINLRNTPEVRAQTYDAPTEAANKPLDSGRMPYGR